MSKGGEQSERLFYEATDGFFGEEEISEAEQDPEISHCISLILGEIGGDSVSGKPKLEQSCRDEASETLELYFGHETDHAQALVAHIEERRRDAVQA